MLLTPMDTIAPPVSWMPRPSRCGRKPGWPSSVNVLSMTGASAIGSLVAICTSSPGAALVMHSCSVADAPQPPGQTQIWLNTGVASAVVLAMRAGTNPAITAATASTRRIITAAPRESVLASYGRGGHRWCQSSVSVAPACRRDAWRDSPAPGGRGWAWAFALTEGGRLCRLEMSGVLGAVRVDEGEAAVGVSSHRPLAFVDQPVVVGAQPGGVVERGLATVSPPGDVVALHHRSPATGEGALAALLNIGSASDRRAEVSGRPADVEDFAPRPENHRDERGIAGEPARSVGADPRTRWQKRRRCRRDLPFQHLQRHDHHDPDGRARERRLRTDVFEVDPRDLAESVMHALAPTAIVGVATPGGGDAQRLTKDRADIRGQRPAEVVNTVHGFGNVEAALGEAPLAGGVGGLVVAHPLEQVVGEALDVARKPVEGVGEQMLRGCVAH